MRFFSRVGMVLSLVVAGVLSWAFVVTPLPVFAQSAIPVSSPPPTARAAWLPATLAPLQACMDRGDCSLDQIVQVVVAFVNFLFGIAGTITLLIFVYAGVLYFVAVVDEKHIVKAKHMMRTSFLGLAIMFCASVAVRFVVIVITRQTPGPTACEDIRDLGGYSCQVMPGSTAKELQTAAADAGCLDQTQNLCAGNPPDVFCCPLEPPQKQKKP